MTQAPTMTEPRAAMVHGGRLDEARQRFPAAPQPFVDLSTGINPVPYPFSPPPLDAFTRLPEPDALGALQAVAARAYGVADPAMVVAAPGTQILISLLPHLLPQAAVAVLGPTYSEHAAAWRAGGAAVAEVGALEAMGRGAAAVLCNPNNPDGRRTPVHNLIDLAPRVRLLVVDEAFADFEEPGLSLAPHLPRPGVVVLRSFGKAYGLAGVRLGFALAEPCTAALIRTALGPWPISGAALHVGCQALADAAWLAHSAQRLLGDGARLDGLLEAAGCRAEGGTRLFRLVRHKEAGRLADRLGSCGVVVRRFAGRPDLLRFGMPAPAHWDRLEAALRGGA